MRWLRRHLRRARHADDDLRVASLLDAAKFSVPQVGDSDEMLILRMKLAAVLDDAAAIRAENIELRDHLAQREERERWNKRGWNA